MLITCKYVQMMSEWRARPLNIKWRDQRTTRCRWASPLPPVPEIHSPHSPTHLETPASHLLIQLPFTGGPEGPPTLQDLTVWPRGGHAQDLRTQSFWARPEPLHFRPSPGDHHCCWYRRCVHSAPGSQLTRVQSHLCPLLTTAWGPELKGALITRLPTTTGFRRLHRDTTGPVPLWSLAHCKPLTIGRLLVSSQG